jgi:hypothetical protein
MSKTTASTLEVAINSPLTPYLFGFIGWTLMWQLQVFLTRAIPGLEFALGVSLVFLPAGIRTLSVLVFGFKGAVGVFFGSMLSTVGYMGHIASMNLWVYTTIGAISAFSAWVAMVLVCHIRGIDQDLNQVSFGDVLAIVFSQGLLSATLHQILFRQFHLDPVFETHSWDHIFVLWAGMATGDIVGSMIMLLSAISAVNFFRASR